MTISNLQSFAYILPEIILGGTALLLFGLDAIWWSRRDRLRFVLPALALAGLASALGVLLLHPPGTEAAAGSRLFAGMIVQDPFAIVFRCLAVAATGVVILLGFGSPSVPRHRRFEYHGLLVLMALGMCLLASANHLLMIYVAIESLSLIGYLVTGFDDRKRRSPEAGLKYVLYGGVASAVMLFGMSLLYGIFGQLSLEGLRTAIAGTPHLDWTLQGAVLGPEASQSFFGPAAAGAAGKWAAIAGFVFLLTGFGFKIAAVPFHMWCPDVYEGAPTPFAALLSVGPKAAGFAVLLRFGMAFVPPGTGLDAVASATARAVPWLLILGVISTLTMTLGNLAAIWQNNLKRLLAYSSIAHAGYMLMGVVAGGRDGYAAVVVYLSVYLIMNLGAFAVVSAVDRATGSEEISTYRGLSRRSPLLALTMAIFLFSLTGLPPTAGFIGKLYLFAALLEGSNPWYTLLAVVGVLNSVVSLYFYARVLKAMYLERVEEKSGEAPIHALNPAGAIAVALAVPTLVLGLFWEPLASIARWSASIF